MSNRLALLQRRHPAVKFALVGCCGFIVDASVLIILYDAMQLDLFVARALAFVAAATSNWILNRRFTFTNRDLANRKSTEWLRFLSSASISAVPNLGIFYLLTRLLPQSLPWIMVAMCCGILSGYVCNYQLARLWVFRAGTP